MIPEALRARDAARLALVVPGLRDVIGRVLAQMESAGFPMTVTAGLRTEAEQFALYRQGRKQDQAGAWVPVALDRRGIVTNCDGTAKRSNHQARADGFGHAVDCAFLIDGPDRDGELETPTWDESRPWSLYGELAETFGGRSVVWGGRWKSLRDLPHVEWTGQ